MIGWSQYVRMYSRRDLTPELVPLLPKLIHFKKVCFPHPESLQLLLTGFARVLNNEIA